MLPDAYLDTLSYDACLARWTGTLTSGSALDVLVAEVGGVVSGFVTLGPSADPDATAAGEIWDLWIDESVWSQGVGSVLLGAALDGLALTHRAALVWVLDGNSRGRAFYARQGAVRDGLSRTTEVTGGRMTDVRHLWDLRGRVPGDPAGTDSLLPANGRT